MKTSKSLSIICQLACLFSGSVFVSLGVPVLVLLIEIDELTKINARESLNFQFNTLAWALLSLLLMPIGVGFVLLAVVIIWSIVAPILASFRILKYPQRPVHYAKIFRIL
ncbi:MAG: DUF4870 domain-containing protein [Cyanobacteria bacterium DS3.002]|jgi:uncharacterized membrane protein|nr:DUF4870 domain-containing protein [Cyanobacteria bacterium DS3.002]